MRVRSTRIFAARRPRVAVWAAPLVVLLALLLAAEHAMAVPVSTARSGRPPSGSSTDRNYVIALTGDTLIHPAVADSAARNAGGRGFDFVPMFDEVAALLHASDLALCHLEVPLDPDGSVAGFPLFSAPGELATALAQAGFDGCSTASNHSLDRGVEGVFETLDLLDAAGLGHTGTARSPEQTGGALYDLGGVVVGHLSYSYGVQNFRQAGDRTWIANRIDVDAIVAAAAELRARGAGFVVVSLHWGEEFALRPTTTQRRQAEELLSRPEIDLIAGHHPHVLQSVEYVAGKPVLFSLGNFLSNQTAPCCPAESEESAVVFVEIASNGDGWATSRIEHVPTWIDRHARHVITPALGESAEASRHRRRLAVAADRGAEALGDAGPGLSPEEARAWITAVSPSPLQALPAGSLPDQGRLFYRHTPLRPWRHRRRMGSFVAL